MNNRHSQTITDLVAEYEAMVEQGTVSFLNGNDCNRLIEYYEEDDQLERALEVVDFALTTHRYSYEFYFKKAHLLLHNNQAGLAMEVLDEAAAYAPAAKEIDLLRAEALVYLKRQEEAAALVEDLKTTTDRQLLSDIYYVESLIYESQEQHERMFFALQETLALNPGHPSALERMWTCIEAGKKYEESLLLHEELLERDPYAYMAWYNLGHTHAYFGSYPEAIECYEFALVINERFEFAFRDCADLCFEIKQYRKALDYYQEIHERFTPDGDLLLRIGQCHQNTGQYRMARTFYEKALSLDPLDDEVFFHLGECFAEEGKWPDAIRYFNKALSIEEGQEEYFAALADAYYHTGAYLQAEPNFVKAIELAPQESRHWIQYACFLMETGQTGKALEALEEAEIYATGSELIYTRIACLCIAGRKKEALYWLGEALAEDYEKHSLLFDLVPELGNDPDILSVIAGYLA